MSLSNEAPVEFVRPSKVYVTNVGWHNYDNAKKYGELVPLTEGRIDYRHTDRIREQIINGLRDFNADLDYVLISGMPALPFEVAAHLLKRFNKVRYLYWEPLMDDYLPRETTGELHNGIASDVNE